MKVNTVFSLRHTHIYTKSDHIPKLWGTKTKPGTGMLPPPRAEIAEPTETIARTGKHPGTPH